MERKAFRLYHDPEARLMCFLPHGLDQTFWEAAGPAFPEWKGLVAKAAMATPEGRRLYQQKLAQLLATAREADFWKKRMDELAGRIRPLASQDPLKGRLWEGAVARLRENIAKRAQHLEKALKSAA